MKLISILFFTLISSIHFSQNQLIGVWKGVSYPANQRLEKNPYYLEIKEENGKITATTREEFLNSENYTVRSCIATVKENSVSINENLIVKKNLSAKQNACKRKITLSMNAASGYLEGNYSSLDCRSDAGKFYFFKVDEKFPDNNVAQASHFWAEKLIENLTNGVDAPDKLAFDRENFNFRPVYFDYDKDVIKLEYESFLNDLIKVVSSHSDLRILVTGNTDSDGSDAYNDDLSKRRAKAIVNYFVSHGLSENHLEFNWNGEKDPVETNETSEGKQKNRRVDFEFINN